MRNEKMRGKRKESRENFARRTSAFDRLCKEGVFARFLLAIGKLEERFDDSFLLTRIRGFFTRIGFRGKVLRRIKTTVARETEQSVILNFIDRCFLSLLYTPLGVYGTFLLLFSLLSTVFLYVRVYLRSASLAPLPESIWGAVGVVLSLTLLLGFNRKTLGKAVTESRILSYLLFDFCGIGRRQFEKEKITEGGYLVALLLGIAAAALTLWVPVTTLFAVCALILFLRVTFLYPEAGLILLAAPSPFLPSRTFCGMILCIALSFLVKFLRGKRNLSVSMRGWILIFFAILVCFSGWIVPVGVSGAGAGRLLVLTLGFLLGRLLTGKEEQTRRLTGAIALSAVAASIYAVLLYAIRLLPAQWSEFFDFLPSSFLPAGFSGKESFGVYLAAVTPVFAYRFLHRKSAGSALIAASAFLPVAAAVILSRSPLAWIAFAASLLLLLIQHRRLHLFTGLFVCAVGILGYYLFFLPAFPEGLSAFSDGFSVSGRAILAALSESASRAFFALGAGTAAQGGNFYTHLLTEQGLIGFLALTLLLLCCLGYGYYGARKGAKNILSYKRTLLGAGAGLMTLLGAGIGSDLWQEEKLVFLLFLLTGALCSAGSALLEEGKLQMHLTDLDRDLVYPAVYARRKSVGKETVKRKVLSSGQPREESGSFLPDNDEGRAQTGESFDALRPVEIEETPQTTQAREETPVSDDEGGKTPETP